MVLRWSDLSGQWSAPAADTFVGAGVLRATPLHCGVAATRLNHDFYRIFGITEIFGMMLLFGQGATLPALSTQALPASTFTLLAGIACVDKPNEAEPRPNIRILHLQIN